MKKALIILFSVCMIGCEGIVWAQKSTEPLASPNLSETQQYIQLWDRANVAWVAFSYIRAATLAKRLPMASTSDQGRVPPNKPIRHPDGHYAAARDRFGQAVSQLMLSRPPAGLVSLHRRLLPLYGEVLGVMNYIVDRANSNDDDAVKQAWARIDVIAEEIQLVISKSQLASPPIGGR